MNSELIIREISTNEIPLIQEFIAQYWGGEPLVIRGKKYYIQSLHGILALSNEKIIGFLMYEIQNQACEIIVFEVFDKFKGIGTQMLDKLKSIAQSKNCKKLCLMTTNDNLDALRFYQRRGFHISGIHLDSVKISREIKPAIGLTGDLGIPLRDEIDLEMPLENSNSK
jgi:N-acetylglutamate synthase-like GNAT family acetyltransferase